MEVVDETMGSSDHSPMIKGRRTKRQRPSSPLSLTMSTSSSNAGGSDGGQDYRYMSPTSSIEFAEEEEDMANCLILLAQGPNPKRIQAEENGRNHEGKFKDTTTTSMGKTGLYVYECKTCNRCFPSFQALGGHRASHKKPKAAVEEKKPLVLYQDEFHFNNFPARNTTNKSTKVHECSICGSEFSSGQALGGHMRRHRASVPTATNINQISSETQDDKKPTHVLGLDLNLPAPEEDRESKFSFVTKQQSLIYSASPLVDCHY